LTTLGSFNRPVRALVVGAGGAIGEALVDALAADPTVARVLACTRSLRPHRDAKVEARPIDILDEASMQSVLVGLQQIDLAIVAAGLLHDTTGLAPEKSWRALDRDMLLKSFATNAVGPALVAKHVLPLLPRHGKSVFAALPDRAPARVGSISDNRLGGWYGYRVSKAALNQLFRKLALELARQRRDAICIGLHPGTVDSALSLPFQAGVGEGRILTPALFAQLLLAAIDSLDTAASPSVV
jgi:NAD(P)-dependent dehydrogenase (short-subunit alcohol dehydrogenase family)